MIKSEVKSLFKNKLLLLVLVAIILIPVIYAGLFVDSIMDPYGNVDQLPVAVVNEDQPENYNDKKLHVGDDLIEELKENDSLQFNFVDKEAAEEGLKNGTFYMAITIPEDFSKNATTLMDDHPEKMELLYETNPGTNYIASKMSETAVLKVRDSIQEAVVKSYAEIIFDSITEVGDGMQEAADGAGELKDGIQTASDGNAKITNNLKKLADSTLTFKDGATTLQKGVKDYTDGVAKVNEGAKQLDEGVGRLTESAPTLVNGVNALDEGIHEYTDGVATLNQNMPALKAGSKSLSDGAKQLQSGVAALQTGLGTYADGADSLANGVTSFINNGITPIETGIAQVYTGVVEGTESSPSLCAGLKSANDGASQLKAMLSPLYENVKNASDNEQITSGLTVKDIKKLYVGISDLQASLSTMNQKVNGTSENDTTSLKYALTALNQGVGQLTSETTGDNGQNVPGVQDQLLLGASQLKQGRSQVEAGLSAIKAGFDGDGTAENPGLVAGLTSLNTGINQVSAGVGKLNENSAKLTSGSSQLVQGASTLGAGATTLGEGTSQLYNGTTTLTKNNKKLNEGSTQLAEGAGQIQEGSEKLYEGSQELGDGMKKLQDGSEELETALQDGADEVKESEASDENIEMFASPVEENGTQMLQVENNGHGMLPYMMSVGLWVGALAFCLIYPLMSYKGKLKSGLSWWASKAVILYPVAMLQGVLLIALLHVFIGFNPVDMARTIVLAMVTAVAFTSIMYFFNITLGKVGSFVMLIYMVVQLAGSAGTYPVELSPHFVSVIHKYLPFTYTVDGFRRTIAGGESIMPCIFVLASIAVVFSILTMIAFQIKTKRIRENKFIFYDWLEEKGLA